MHDKSKYIATLTLLSALMFLGACNDGPTSSSSFDTDFGSGGAAGPRTLAVEQFNCTSIGEVHVRFSDPGSVDGDAATMWFSYRGVPDGIHALNVIWDEDNAPQSREAVEIDDGTTPSANDGFVDIQGTVAHTYPAVSDDTKRTVRAELTMNDQTGNCSTVRHIEQAATPPPPPPKRRCRVAGVPCRIF